VALSGGGGGNGSSDVTVTVAVVGGAVAAVVVGAVGSEADVVVGLFVDAAVTGEVRGVVAVVTVVGAMLIGVGVAVVAGDAVWPELLHAASRAIAAAVIVAVSVAVAGSSAIGNRRTRRAGERFGSDRSVIVPPPGRVRTSISTTLHRRQNLSGTNCSRRRCVPNHGEIGKTNDPFNRSPLVAVIVTRTAAVRPPTARRIARRVTLFERWVTTAKLCGLK
jgi:hypothetical protein